MRIYTKMSRVLVCFYLMNNIASAQETTPYLNIIPDGCEAIYKNNQWGIFCPDNVNEKRAEDMRTRPTPILPGYSSNGTGFVPSKPRAGGGSYDYPHLCAPKRKEWSKRTDYFINALRKHRYCNKHNCLTAQAAFSVDRIVREYTNTIDKEAMAKYRYSPEGQSLQGDRSCVAHYDGALKELKRIADLVMAELLLGNRDLKNTGLNERESPYNK